MPQAPIKNRSEQLRSLMDDQSTTDEFMRLMIGTFVYHNPKEAELLLEHCLNEELFPALSELDIITTEEIQHIIFEHDVEIAKSSGQLIRDRSQLAFLRLYSYRRVQQRLSEASDDRKQIILETVFDGDFETAHDWFIDQRHPDLFGLLMAASKAPLMDDSDRMSAEKQAGILLAKVVYPWEFFHFKTDPDDPCQIEEDLMAYLNKRFGAGTYESLMGHLTDGVVMPLDELPPPDDILVEEAVALKHNPPIEKTEDED